MVFEGIPDMRIGASKTKGNVSNNTLLECMFGSYL